MSVARMRERIREARERQPRRGILTRSRVAELAELVPGGSPRVDEDLIRQLECRQVVAPEDGHALLTLVAALRLDPFDVQRDVGYFPPLPPSAAEAPGWSAHLVGLLARQLGATCRREGAGGRRLVVKLPP